MKKIKVRIDRPIGYKNLFGTIYSVNYGYVEGIIGGDGEEQDVYVLGVDQPVAVFEGELIAVIHRRDDVEEKWVAVPESVRFTKKEIEEAVFFIEQYFDSYIELLK